MPSDEPIWDFIKLATAVIGSATTSSSRPPTT